MNAVTVLFLCALFHYSSQELKLVHVLFRHGGRAPDANEIYPKDPYINDTYFPIGFGGMTEVGNNQEYKIGRYLRRRYNNFLGNTYYPNVLDAWSTDLNRTKASLELVLAGLWPPTISQTWNFFLPWLPIPYNYIMPDRDRLLFIDPKNPVKPNYTRAYEEVIGSEEVKNFMQKNSKTFKFIEENTGLNITRPWNVFRLYFGLVAKEHLRLELPKWVKKVYPKFLEEVVTFEYKIQTYTRSMLRESIGYLWQKILNDSQNRIQSPETETTRKIYLYSAHEMQVAHSLKLLTGKADHVPPYGAFLITELHKNNGNYSLEFYYQNYTYGYPQPICLKGCTCSCPIKDFTRLTSDLRTSEYFIK